MGEREREKEREIERGSERERETAGERGGRAAKDPWQEPISGHCGKE